MKAKKALQSKYSYIALFVISAIVLIAPLLFGFNPKNFQALGLFGIGILNFISSATLFLPTPGFLAVGLGGKYYNPIFVALVAAFGSTLGEAVGFAFGYSSTKLTESKQKYLVKLENFFRSRYAPFVIILLALIPNPFFDAVGIVAGVSLYPIRKFLFFVFIGRFLRDLLIAFVGRQILT